MGMDLVLHIPFNSHSQIGYMYTFILNICWVTSVLYTSTHYVISIDLWIPTTSILFLQTGYAEYFCLSYNCFGSRPDAKVVPWSLTTDRNNCDWESNHVARGGCIFLDYLRPHCISYYDTAAIVAQATGSMENQDVNAPSAEGISFLLPEIAARVKRLQGSPPTEETLVQTRTDAMFAA